MDSSGTTTVSTTNAIDLTSLTVSVTTNGGAETHTSSFSVLVEDCLAEATIASIGVKKVQKSSSSNTIDAGFSSSANCAPSSYVLNKDISGVTIDEAG